MPDNRSVTVTKPRLAPGLYDSLIDANLGRLIEQLRISDVPVDAQQLSKLSDDEAIVVLVRYLGELLRELLHAQPDVRLRRVQAVLRALAQAEIPEPAEVLYAVAESTRPTLAEPFPPRPTIPLDRSDLLVNANGERSVLKVIREEIASADRIDVIMAFVLRSGVKLLQSDLKAHVERRGAEPPALRLITSTYLGISEPDAIDWLRDLGATIRVGYDPRTVKLHAKAWIFHRNSGTSTAYVGSSNLSRTALIDGREWNVRLAALETPDVIKKLADSFEVLWADPDFQSYAPGAFAAVRAHERQRQSGGAETGFAGLDIRPYPFQAEILERLQVERELHGCCRNLVVAATGTGKTVIAAFDYKRLRDELKASRQRATLLFVAHRKEILDKARATFRAVLREPEFGEMLVDGHEPRVGTAVFASVQSLQGRLQSMDPSEFSVVIIDEFHHAEAPTYQRLLTRLEPKYLLGLTATPERSDGADILRWFDNRVAAEIRLWDALSRDLLCPFHYYGVADTVDLSQVRWSRGGYDRGDLERVFDGNVARELLVRRAIREYVPDPSRMRALGFCVGVRHAQYMARRFCAAGIPAKAVTGEMPPDHRRGVVEELVRGDLRIIFCVDVFNEGIDIPEVDTLLFLRPTESATLFLQQLGRGLRRAEGKTLTTVLDFIGNNHVKFRFDRRYRALLAGRGGSIVKQIEQGFPFLPPGCAIKLEAEASEMVLDNVKRALANQRQVAVDELRGLGKSHALGEFLDVMGWDTRDLYRRRAASWTWSGLRAEAGLCAVGDETFDQLGRTIGKFAHIEDDLRVLRWKEWLAGDRPPNLKKASETDLRLLRMLLTVLWTRQFGDFGDLTAAARPLWRQTEIRRELVELLALRRAAREHRDLEFTERPSIPLRVHARYHVDEVLAACGLIDAGRYLSQQSGMRYVEGEKVILNFVTIDKDPERYSPGTRYRDFAMSPGLFHSESPNSYSPDSGAGRRLVHHAERGVVVMLFVREAPKTPEGFTTPYVFLGATSLLEHTGRKPISLTWKLAHEIPPWFYPQTQLTST